MENNLTIQENSERYFLEKKEQIIQDINLPTVIFLKKSYEFEKIKELKQNPNFVFLITGWIAQTSLLMQIKNPIDSFIKQDIINMLVNHYSSISIEELIKAFELERFAVYKEKTEHYQLFDTTYISAVLKKYKEWKQKNKIEFNINQEAKMENQLTPEEIDKSLINAINNAYSFFLSNNDIQEPFLYIFQDLIDRGLLKMPNKNTPKMLDYYIKKYNEAIDQIKTEAENFTSTDKNERQKNRAILQSVLTDLENKEAKNKVEIRSKKLVLIDFFTKYKNENKEVII